MTDSEMVLLIFDLHLNGCHLERLDLAIKGDDIGPKDRERF
jgi:hypothetical protein